jgi:hypothetical protein
MTPSEQIASAEATASFMEDFLKNLEAVREEAQEYKSNVSLFPRICEAAFRMEQHLVNAKRIAAWIDQQNEDFRREGEARLAAEQRERDAQTASESGTTDRRNAVIERIAAELEDLDIGADARVVVRVAVIEDSGEEHSL